MVNLKDYLDKISGLTNDFVSDNCFSHENVDVLTGISEIILKLKELESAINKGAIKGDKGDRGERGYKGEKGDKGDSCDPSVINNLTNEVNKLNEVKSDKSTTNSLQGQINNLVIKNDGNNIAEISQARANFLGVEFGSLAERILSIEYILSGSSFPITGVIWEEGGINTNTGDDTPVSGYIRNRGYLSFKGLKNVKFNLNNSSVYLYEYSRENKTFINFVTKDTTFEINNLDNYFRVVVKSSDDITVDNVLNYINIEGSYTFK